MTYKTHVEQGVTYHFLYEEDKPLYIRFIFNAGSCYDKKEGTAHFLEHMLVAGTKRFPTKNLLTEYIENIGGQVSLSTDADYIKINFEISSSEDIDTVKELLNEMIHHSLFDKQTFEKERKAILEEYAGKKSNPREFVWEVYRRLFFQGSSYGTSTLGNPDSIHSINCEDIIAFKETHLLQNITVIVAGDVNRSLFIDTIRPIFEIKKPNSKKLNFSPSQVKKYDIEPYSISNTDLIIGYHTGPQNLQDKVCFDILSAYFATGRSSALITKLRYEKGLVYSVSAINRTWKNRGTWVIKTQCNEKNIEETLQIIKETIKNFENEFSAEKLTAIKVRLTKQLIIRLQSVQSWVEQNEQLTMMEKPSTITDYLDALHKITLSDLVIAYKKMSANSLLMASCGPISVEDALSRFSS